MIPLTLAEIAACTGGYVVGADPATVVRGAASVDSRSVPAGGLFVAVAGERVDGHDFAADAVAGGAAGCLLAQSVGVPGVVVTDTVLALGRLAAHIRSRLGDCTVVALTGSQGKTSTKDLLSQLLSAHGETEAAVGSHNNEIGLPLTILRADVGTCYLVLEMGARAGGQIGYLCQVAQPDIGVVLNVGVAHLGEFGTREAIALAKGELVESLASTGTAVLNRDDPLVAAMQARTGAAVLTYGEHTEADVGVRDLRLDDGGRPAFTLTYHEEQTQVQMRLLGAHSAHNGAAAAAVALTAGVDLSDVGRSLSTATVTSPWRMEAHERDDGVLVINDSYNANPDSVRAALSTLVSVARGRGRARTIAVLGEMLELGDTSVDQHAEIGRLVGRLGVSRLVVVGDGAEAVHRGACLEGLPAGRSVLVPDADAATAWLHRHLRPGDVVLVKASRAVGLDRVGTALLTGDNAGSVR